MSSLFPLVRIRFAFRWDVVGVLVVWLATPLAVVAARQQPAPPSAAPPVQVHDLFRDDDLSLALVQPTHAVGLVGTRLRIGRPGAAVVEAPLDGTLTARRARRIGDVRVVPQARRAVLRLDPAYDPSGLLIVDLDAGAVVDAVTARDPTPSPDGRFWAFEEPAFRTVEDWPHTETVYAVYDVAAPPADNARSCPGADERCRGRVLFLPDRLALCREIARERGGSCVTPANQPRHGRRSPFAWLSATELAWVDVDIARQVATLVVATLHASAPPDVVAVPLERSRVLEDVAFPSTREAWRIDDITRDADRSRVWLHFRNPLPQAPTGRLGIRLS